MHSLTSPLETLPQKLLVGLSGGVDSCVLYHCLKNLQPRRTLIVAHFNHGWRKESSAEALFVKALASDSGDLFTTARAAKDIAHTESAARAARWDFFKRASRRFDCPDLVLAHHANDQSETLLLQLFRGTGGGGAGMRPLHEREGLRIHRPWLSINKSTLKAYAQTQSLSWKEDTSNQDLHHRRNFLRLNLLPQIEQNFGPGVIDRLTQTAQTLRLQNDWIESLVAPEAATERLEVTVLKSLSPGHLRALLHYWLKAKGVGDLSFATIEAAASLLTQERPAKINLSKGRFLRRRAGKLFVE